VADTLFLYDSKIFTSRLLLRLAAVPQGSGVGLGPKILEFGSAVTTRGDFFTVLSPWAQKTKETNLVCRRSGRFASQSRSVRCAVVPVVRNLWLPIASTVPAADVRRRIIRNCPVGLIGQHFLPSCQYSRGEAL
jgi:hypothetical protein